MADCYITLLPYSVSDHERIFKTKTGPQQRIKVTATSTLANVATYVLNLATNSRTSTTYVKLFVDNGSERLGLPFSLSVGEFLCISNRTREGAVYYLFVDEQTREPPRKPDQHPVPEKHIPPEPELPSSPVFTPVYHSGISMFSNSFGRSLPAYDSRGEAPTLAHEATMASAVDLRRQLEALLSGSSTE
jgi:hypothetical protein